MMDALTSMNLAYVSNKLSASVTHDLSGFIMLDFWRHDEADNLLLTYQDRMAIKCG